MDSPRLIFVYNADAGMVNTLRDIWVRVTSPSTYPCSLCALTYGPGGCTRGERSSPRPLSLPVVFLHKDEFARELGEQALRVMPPPVAVIDDGVTRAEVVGSAQMPAATSVEDLIADATDGLRRHGRHA